MPSLRILAVFCGLTVGVVYLVLTLSGPMGVTALQGKWQEIRDLQTSNADLKHEVESRKERVEKLKSSTTEQELEIRKRLKMVRPGETVFILPEKQDSDPAK